MAFKIDGNSPPKHDRQSDFRAAMSRRDYVIRVIGIDNLDRFEQWAFRDIDIIYDKKISLLWANVHSTKDGIPEDADQAIKTIVLMWLSRHSQEARQDREIITIVEDEFPGPGLDDDPLYSTGEDIPNPHTDIYEPPTEGIAYSTGDE